VFIALYFMTGPTPVKRKIQRGLKLISPLIALYIAVGWGSNAGVFKPVRIIRSAVDSNTDSSTAWRDIENFDLLYTFRQTPIFGTGYGHGFWEIMPLPAVDYQLERFIPHNSILGLWTYCGLVGFTAITLLWVSGVYFGIRAYHASTTPRDKSAALVCFGAFLIHYLQCYGDMGLGSWTGVWMLAPSLAMAGKLAVTTGAWTANERSGVARVGAKAAGPRVNSKIPGAF
jgi:O-antigen ligase